MTVAEIRSLIEEHALKVRIHPPQISRACGLQVLPEEWRTDRQKVEDQGGAD